MAKMVGADPGVLGHLAEGGNSGEVFANVFLGAANTNLTGGLLWLRTKRLAKKREEHGGDAAIQDALFAGTHRLGKCRQRFHFRAYDRIFNPVHGDGAERKFYPRGKLNMQAEILASGVEILIMSLIGSVNHGGTLAERNGRAVLNAGDPGAGGMIDHFDGFVHVPAAVVFFDRAAVPAGHKAENAAILGVMEKSFPGGEVKIHEKKAE